MTKNTTAILLSTLLSTSTLAAPALEFQNTLGLSSEDCTCPPKVAAALSEHLKLNFSNSSVTHLQNANLDNYTAYRIYEDSRTYDIYQKGCGLPLSRVELQFALNFKHEFPNSIVDTVKCTTSGEGNYKLSSCIVNSNELKYGGSCTPKKDSTNMVDCTLLLARE